MKKLLLVLLALTAMSFASKDGQIRTQQEIDTYLATNKVSDFDKSCILDGQYQVGMAASTIQFMLGEPAETNYIKRPWGKQEEWVYKRGRKTAYRFIIEDGGVVGIMQEDK